ncbi:MAG: hypothetical protein V4731_14295 [Pseudomonadota bacterium]
MILIKLFFVPFLVLLITLAGRRWGPSVAGWVAGFPVVTGPTLLFITLDQGTSFAAAAAHASLIAVLGNASFIVAYAWMALRAPWYGAAAVGVGAFALVGSALTMFHADLELALITTVLGLIAASRSFPKVALGKAARPPSSLELPIRCVAAGAMSLAVMQMADRLGPTTSGLIAVFPVLGLLFGVFSQLVWGGAGAAHLLAGMIQGLYAFTTFCFVLAMTLSAMDTTWAFLAALMSALLVQFFTFKRLANASH